MEGGGLDLWGRLPGWPEENHDKLQSGARSSDIEI